MKTLYLCGAGNPDGIRLAQRIQALHPRWERLVVLDDDPARHGGSQLGVPIAGGFALLAQADPARSELVNLVARTTARRAAAQARLAGFGLPFAALTDPSVDAEGAQLADDTLVYRNASIGAEASVGAGSVVFMGAVVGHESRVGRGCVVGANAVLNARVRLDEGVYVGSNATILPEIAIGAWATVGAGSVVLADVPAGATVMGVPAQILSLPELPEATGRPGRPERSVQPLPEGSRVLDLPDVAAQAGTHSGELELVVSGIWRDVLGLPDVPSDQNFFDLGGNSLCALKVYERLRRSGWSGLSITDLFQYPTVHALAEHLSALNGAAVESFASERPAVRHRRAMPWRGGLRQR